MAQNETGYAKNSGNFKLELEYCKSLDTGYNPTSNPRITIAAMQTLHVAGFTSLGEWVDAENDWGIAVKTNEANYKLSKPKATRINATAKSCGTTPEIYSKVKALCDIIRGWRLTAKPKPGTPEFDKAISSSHQSYDNLNRTWSQLEDLLSKIPEYQPDASDITVAAINTYRQSLISTLADDKEKFTIVLTKRNARNKIFDLIPTGICDVAQQAKDYIKGKFGASSFEYKHVAKIHFRRYPLT